MQEPLAYLGSSDPDTMYSDQAMKQLDHKEFLNASIREVDNHYQLKNCNLLRREEVPKVKSIQDSVWEMKRKREIVTRQFYKWKVGLNVHGRNQEYWFNYLDTQSPIVTWFYIRTLLTLAIINTWNSIQVDFVKAYPQLFISYDLYMELPKGFKTRDRDV